jgi:hypothetical protein
MYTLLGFYTVWNDNSVPTFWDTLSAPSSRFKQSSSSSSLSSSSSSLGLLDLEVGTDRFPEMLVWIYHSKLFKDPEG